MTSAKRVPPKAAKWPRIRETTKNDRKVFIVDARLKKKGRRYDCQTRIEAESLAESLRIQRANEGNSSFELTPAERTAAQEAIGMLRPHGRTIQEAVRFYLKNMDVIKREVMLAPFIEEVMANKKDDGIAYYTFMSQRTFYRRFSREFPDAKLMDFTTPMLDDWLRKQKVKGTSRNSFRANLRSLFNIAKRRRYLIDNPIDGTAHVRVDRPAPFILSADQCVRLLNACVDLENPKMLVSIALGLFAGLPDHGRTHQPRRPEALTQSTMFNLRPYQQQCCQAVENSFSRDGFNRSLAVLATAAGKTVIFSRLARYWINEKAGRVLVLADRDELIAQAVAKLESAAGLRADVEKAERQAAVGAPLVVSSIQTMSRRLRKWPPGSFSHIIADEAHLAMASNWQRTLKHLCGFHPDTDLPLPEEAPEVFDDGRGQPRIAGHLRRAGHGGSAPARGRAGGVHGRHRRASELHPTHAGLERERTR